MISKALEEYVKTMYVLKKQVGEIRVTDIAEKMNCSKASVTKSLNSLAKYLHTTLGLVNLDCRYDINQKKCRDCIKRNTVKQNNE